VRVKRVRRRAAVLTKTEACLLESRQLLSAVAWSAGPGLPSARAQEAVIADGAGKLYKVYLSPMALFPDPMDSP
jgi:hypothetical protein